MGIIWLLAGVILGFILAKLVGGFKRPSGTLKIDHSSFEKDVYRFEIDDLDSLSTKKHVVLKVDNNADLSQK